jgi:nitrite reductase (NO-forming)
MKLRTLSLALLVTALGLVLAPAAISKPAATKATTVLVTAKEFKFTLSKRTVPKGIVTFKVTNKGALPHDFKISGKKTPMIKPGKSATLKVTLTKGAKPYICTVPGHAAAGMKGSLRVT